MALKIPDLSGVPCTDRYVARLGHMTFPANTDFVQPPVPANVSQALSDAACQPWVADPLVQLQDSRPELPTVAVPMLLVTPEVPALAVPAVPTMKSRPLLRRATASSVARPTLQRQNWEVQRGLLRQEQAPARQLEATK